MIPRARAGFIFIFVTVLLDMVSFGVIIPVFPQLIADLESEVTMPEGFILPGATAASGAIDLARAIARRAERRCVSLENAGGLRNPAVRRWLNRMSLLLFVLARYEENLAGRPAPPAKRSTARRSS